MNIQLLLRRAHTLVLFNLAGAVAAGCGTHSSEGAPSAPDGSSPTRDAGSTFSDAASLLDAKASSPDARAGVDASHIGDAAAATDALWQSRGVGGGGALFVPEISPFDDQLYMATDMGAAFQSTDFGQTWVTRDWRVLSGGNSAQVRFSSDPNTLFAIGADSNGDSALVASSNAGVSFSPVAAASGIGPFYLEVDPTSATRLFVTDYTVLHFSNDGGKTFASVYTGANSSAGLIMGGAFWNGQDIYVGTNDGLIVSHNGGGSFALEALAGLVAGEAILSFAGASSGGTIRFFAVTNASASIYAGIETCEANGTYGGVYWMNVGDAAWTSVTAAIPSGDQPTYVGMALNDVTTAYVAGTNTNTNGPSVSKTTNGGTSWTSVFHTANNANIATGWSGAGGDSDWSFGQCAEGFAVSKADSTRAVLTDMGFVHLTSDGAETWRQAYVNPADQNPAGASTPKGKAYRTSGVEQTSGWWVTWADATTIFGSLTDIRSVRSINAGVAWARESTNGLTLNTTYQTLVHPSGALYAATAAVHDMYMSYRLEDAQLDSGDGKVMTSADKGATWTVVHDFGHNVVFLALDQNSADSMYVSVEHSSAGGIFHTANLSSGASATWTQLANPPRTQGHPYNIVVLADGTVAVTYSGRRDSAGAFTASSGVFVSADKGSTWIDVSDPNMHYWTKDLVVDPNDSTQNTWYVGVFMPFGPGVSGTENGLFRTTDRGQHWAQIWTGFNVESCRVDPLNPNHLFATTDSGGLFTTNDLSSATPTFTSDPDYPFAHPLRVFFNPNDSSEAWVASFGGGLRVRHF